MPTPNIDIDMFVGLGYFFEIISSRNEMGLLAFALLVHIFLQFLDNYHLFSFDLYFIKVSYQCLNFEFLF